jgi:formimidoylglutamate deiminase
MKWLAEHAWVDGAWASQVLLEADASGHWQRVQAQATPLESQGAQPLGTVLPGMTNAHSHAFQRAMAGLAERSDRAQDDFWSWRERMYQVALRIGPDALESVAAWLYAEMLRAGYTQVCEFHYVHRDPQGHAYADPAEMAWALVRAAQRTGMGLTLLPTVYMRQGFGQDSLNDTQRRFRADPDFVLEVQARLAQHAQTHRPGLLHSGVALHSLRAVPLSALRDVDQALPHAPLHIHVAEQDKEVQDCLAHHGHRPIEWLAEQLPLNARWHLVHATHATPEELRALQACGASVVLCPTTEANLGDGRFDWVTALSLGLKGSVGTDSHVNRNWTEELRWLEYVQRLQWQQRNVSLLHQAGETAGQLFNWALDGGAAASGLPLRGLAVGQRADMVELDLSSDALLGVPAAHVLDAWVFSTPSSNVRRVFVGAQAVPDRRAELAPGFVQAMASLLS